MHKVTMTSSTTSQQVENQNNLWNSKTFASSKTQKAPQPNSSMKTMPTNSFRFRTWEFWSRLAAWFQLRVLEQFAFFWCHTSRWEESENKLPIVKHGERECDKKRNARWFTCIAENRSTMCIFRMKFLHVRNLGQQISIKIWNSAWSIRVSALQGCYLNSLNDFDGHFLSPHNMLANTKVFWFLPMR